MSLSEVQYQGHAQDMLQRAFSRDRVPHAYLFHGPEGVGKESLARRFARLLLCDNPIDRPLDGDLAKHVGVSNIRTGCANCESCRLVVAETHPDIHFVYRQLNRQHPEAKVRARTGREIGVDVIRHFLVEKVRLTPVRGRAKVFLVREADRMTPEAQNALLKSLEEPPGPTYIVLLTASADRLLPTTLSRCQLVEFSALPLSFVREKLALLHPELSEEQLNWYARSTEGSLGRAEDAIRLDLYAIGEQVLRSIESLDQADTTKIFDPWKTLAETIGPKSAKGDPDVTPLESRRIGFKIIFTIVANWYADALRVRNGRRKDLVNASHSSAIATVARDLDHDAIIDRINRLAQAQWHLDRNVHPQVCVETLVGDLACGVGV